MPSVEPVRKPGDLILDRYMPDASPKERDDARDNLRALIHVLARLIARDPLNDDAHDIL